MPLDFLIRRHDEDRWLASRFAPVKVRERLGALYALNHEIARTASVVTQAALGDIRLAWWREAIGDIYAGKPARAHPVLGAFAAALRETPWPRAVFETLITAREADFEAAPFSTWDALDAYLDATAGGVMRLALIACGAEAPEALVRGAAWAWGCTGLARAGRTPIAGAAPDALVQRAREMHRQIRGARFETSAFPAIGYVALVPGYLRALERKAGAPMLLTRQLTLIAASARGRL